MSKEIIVELPSQSKNVAPSRDAIASALSEFKVISVKRVQRGQDGGWQVLAEVEEKKVSKPKPALKQVVKPAVKPKATAKKPSLGKKKDSE